MTWRHKTNLFSKSSRYFMVTKTPIRLFSFKLITNVLPKSLVFFLSNLTSLLLYDLFMQYTNFKNSGKADYGNRLGIF